MRDIRWLVVRTGAYLFMFACLALLPLARIEQTSYCLILRTTGRHCFMCGMTRAFARALHGDLRGALSWNPLVAVFLPVCLLIALDELITLIVRLRGGNRRSLVEKLLSIRAESAKKR